MTGLVDPDCESLNVCARRLVRNRLKNRHSAFFENVFVLRVSNGESPLRSGADYKLKTDRPRYGSDEGDCSVGICARTDFAFPFAKIKDSRGSRRADLNFPKQRIGVASRELGAFGGIGGDGDQLALGCEAGEEVFSIGFQLGVCLRAPVEENLKQLAAEAIANHPPGIAVR